MFTRDRITTLTSIVLIAVLNAMAFAGPEDQFTKYPVGVGIGGTIVSGIADSGGTTTISFADAKRLGILNGDGDPGDFDADGTQRMGGTGGGVVVCHIFRNIWVTVQPRKADGTPNGPARTVKVTIFVPKKPSEQTGANDAEKRRKTRSVPTKIGANVCGAEIDGHKLDLSDKATADPKKNKRSTGWRRIAGGGGGGKGDTGGADRRAPVQEDDNYEDEAFFEPMLPELWINGLPCAGTINAAPATCFGWEAAQQFGVFPIGQEILDFDNHRALFMAGLLDTLPDENNPLVLPIGHCLVEIPTFEGDAIALQPVLAFILPEGDPWQVVIGGNGLVPPGTSMWLDSDQHQLLWDLDGPCIADFNGDGAVNTIDMLEFLNAWTAQNPEADINGDDSVNTIDVIEFLNAWTQGCG